ncbi:MAG TPA: M1 family aminopeptidase [Candidatus Tyrphobacter sp.]
MTIDDRRAFALPGASPQYGPDKPVDVEHIDLHLIPNLDEALLDGRCTTTVRAIDEDVVRLSLDAVDLDVHAVERDDRPQAWTHRDGHLEITFDPPLRAGEQTSFSVKYRVEHPRHGLFFVHSTAEAPRVPHLWTQCQDENARYWFPCFDYPHEKQTTSTTVVVRKGEFALSNGALVERRDDGEHTIFRYRQDVPHSTYLVTLVVGPFVEIAQGNAGAHNVPVFAYVLPGREADGMRAFGNTPRMIDFFERRIGTPYPYARYSQIAVSDFIFGGMENTSATTQTDRTLHDETAHLDFSSDPLVAHELAHQWFGDLLTCRDWSQAWLNEGFATYFECLWREEDLGYDEYLYDVFTGLERYLDEDRRRYRRPIVYNRYRDPIELFDRHLYEKGAAVLHMLRGELGDARFFRSIARYVSQNAQRNVETIDLIRAIEEATGRNLRGFFDRWIFGPGYPELEYRFAWDAKRRVATLTIDQKQSVDAEHPAALFDLDVGFVPALDEAPASNRRGELPGERRVRVHVERAHETVAVALEQEPKLVRIDPGAFVVGSVTYRLGSELAAAALRADPDAIARVRAARELVRDGSRHAQKTLAHAFSHERFWGVLEAAATALGATRAPWARDMLLNALGHEHPKVRRATAAALGSFRDAQTADALLARIEGDPSYFVRAAACMSLGKTRDARAIGVLTAVLERSTWNGVVEAGAVRGLAELADPRAVRAIIGAASPSRDEGLRCAAARSMARACELIEGERARLVDALERLLDDQMLLVAIAAIDAGAVTEDARLLPALDRLTRSAIDGRARRRAAEAAIRIREGRGVPAAVTSLRCDLDELREQQQRLRESFEAISPR